MCVYNIKSKYIDGSEETNSKVELQKQFDKYYANLKKQVTYSFKPYPDTGIDLDLGDAVKLTYGDTVVYNRVISFEKKIDYSVDATYNLSFYTTKGIVNSLKDEVKSLSVTMSNMNIQQGSSGGTSVKDGIWNLVTNDDGVKFIHGKYDVFVDGDVTVFHSDNGKYRGTTIMDGILVDGKTIRINEKGQLEVIK